MLEQGQVLALVADVGEEGRALRARLDAREEVRLLDRRHVDRRMPGERVVDRRGPRLGRSDQEQVRPHGQPPAAVAVPCPESRPEAGAARSRGARQSTAASTTTANAIVAWRAGSVKLPLIQVTMNGSRVA